MMKSQLDLAFVPVIGNLIHIAALKSQSIRNAIPDCIVETITIKQFNLFIITDLPFANSKDP